MNHSSRRPRAFCRLHFGFVSLLTLLAATLPGHAADVSLGIGLTGPGGANWSNFGNYDVGGQTSFVFVDASAPYGGDAFDYAGQVLVNGVAYANPDGDVDLTGNTITSDPAVVSGLTVSVQYTALTGSQTLRCLVTMTNASGSPLVGLPVSYRSNWGSDGSTTIRATSSGDLSYGTDDIWSVTSDSSDSDPVNISVFGSPGNTALSAITGTVFSSAGTEGLGVTYNLDFAPGQTRHLLFFHEMVDTSANAITQAQVYNNPLTGERAAGLPAQGIVNFVTSAPKLVWSDYTGNVYTANLDGTNQTVIASSGFGGVAVDNATGRVYWGASGGLIRSANIDGSDPQVLVSTGSTTVWNLAIAGNQLVFNSSGSSGTTGVGRVNLDGSGLVRIGDNTDGEGIAYDPQTDLVYYQVFGGADPFGTVKTVPLDGLTSPAALPIQPPLAFTPGLSVDSVNDHLYWARPGSGVWRSNLDGSGFTLIRDLTSSDYSIHFHQDSGKLYWGTRSTGQIGHMSPDGSNLETLITTSGSFYALTIYQPLSAPAPLPEIAVADVTAGAPGTDLTDGQAGVIAFGCAQPGTTPTRNFEIRNEGTGNLVLPNNALSLPTGYAIVGGWPAGGTVTIPAGQSWSDVVGTPLAVRLIAATEGVYAGSWSLANNDPDEDPFDFTITGTIDGTAPTLNGLPADFVVTVVSGCSALVNWIEPTASDNLDGSPSLARTSGSAPGTILPVGDHLIEYTSSDCAGNVTVGSFTATVIETVPPMLLGCPPRVSVLNLPPGAMSIPITYTAPTASDNCDPSPTVTCTPPSGLSFGLGDHVFTCVAEDWSGNQTVETFRVVVVESQVSPTPRAAEVVAERNESAPGVAGATLNVVNHAFLNEAGGVLIEASLSGAGAGAVGLWKNVGSGLELVSRNGEVAPGSGGFTFTRYDDTMLNDAGDVAFEGYLAAGAPTSANMGHWAEVSGTLQKSALKGDTPPATSAVFSILHEPAFDGTGATLTPANLLIDNTLVTIANDTGIWRKPAAGPLLQVAREGSPLDAAAGLPGAAYGHVASRVVANGSGEVAFFSFLDVGPGGVTLADNAAVFAGSPGSIGLVARENEVAPGSDPTLFLTFNAESINNNGDVAFEATLKTGGGGSAVVASNNTGIYTNSNGSLELVAREGDPVHECGPPGAVFSDFRAIFIADNGDVFFHAFLAGPGVGSSNDGGFWRWRSAASRLEPVLVEGETAPSAQGAILASLLDFAVSDGGAQAVTATLAPGVGDCTLANNFGLWMDDGSVGVPILRVRESDPVDLALPSETPALTVLFIDRTTNVSGGSGGRGKVLNDLGEVIVRTSFNQNTSGAIILSSP